MEDAVSQLHRMLAQTENPNPSCNTSAAPLGTSATYQAEASHDLTGFHHALIYCERSAPHLSKMMRFRICFPAFLLALLAVVNALVEDSTIAQPYDAGTLPIGSRVAAQRREAEKECGFQGNSDLYGLGVRIGIYLQVSS